MCGTIGPQTQASGVKPETGPCMQRVGVDQRGRPLQIGCGKFNKQGNLFTRLVLGSGKMRSPYLPARMVNIYMKALMGFSHTYSADSLSNTLLSQDCLFKMATATGIVGGMYIPEMGKR